VTLKPAKTGEAAHSKSSIGQVLFPRLMWGIAILMVALAVYLAVNRPPTVFSKAPEAKAPTPTFVATLANMSEAVLPQLSPVKPAALSRTSELHTDIPKRATDESQTYTVENGDSVFAIAEYFKLKPDTIVWANNSILNDNPDSLNIGQRLVIPPVDGVMHKWQASDTFQSVANLYKTDMQKILMWPGNKLDLINPVVQPGTTIIVPDGVREYRRTWIMPTIARGAAGVAASMPGTCNTGEGGAVGTGSFIWPGPAHTISGNPFWSGHLAIDIAIGIGTPVVASDSGVVVYSGWSTVGYGNVVMIDHGNGFQTLYAHLSAALARCGASVAKGSVIGTGGSTGNSTGPHLHFEIRYLGGFVNPISYLH
jgi:murein DD-endopeptidase MepM/ murein hydrolase activator NlpD